MKYLIPRPDKIGTPLLQRGMGRMNKVDFQMKHSWFARGNHKEEYDYLVNSE